MSISMLLAVSLALPQAEFAKYHELITGRAPDEGLVSFAIDPSVSKTGRDAYSIVSTGETPVVPVSTGKMPVVPVCAPPTIPSARSSCRKSIPSASSIPTWRILSDKLRPLQRDLPRVVTVALSSAGRTCARA